MSLGSDKTQTNILTVGFITAMLVMLTAPVIFAIADENNDWPNALTLVVEVAVGAIIAVIVYIHSKAQHKENQKSNNRTNRILEELERSHMAERRLVSDALVPRVDDVIRILKYALQQDNKHNGMPAEEREKILARQQRKIINLPSRLNLIIPYYELARIFDETAARLYRDLQTHIGTIPTEFSSIEDYDDERAYVVESWEACLHKCQMLGDYVEELMKDYDTALNSN